MPESSTFPGVYCAFYTSLLCVVRRLSNRNIYLRIERPLRRSNQIVESLVPCAFVYYIHLLFLNGNVHLSAVEMLLPRGNSFLAMKQCRTYYGFERLRC